MLSSVPSPCQNGEGPQDAHSAVLSHRRSDHDGQTPALKSPTSATSYRLVVAVGMDHCLQLPCTYLQQGVIGGWHKGRCPTISRITCTSSNLPVPHRLLLPHALSVPLQECALAKHSPPSSVAVHGRQPALGVAPPRSTASPILIKPASTPTDFRYLTLCLYGWTTSTAWRHSCEPMSVW